MQNGTIIFVKNVINDRENDLIIEKRINKRGVLEAVRMVINRVLVVPLFIDPLPKPRK